ncbi:hypothetical protein E0765_04700 [Sulfuricurvum sp. IAE1]|uniref:hypothetical protein n=1 Tax=Sulfuricurvum sp. IAE1 TaxID=2546102 RepID=UPI001044D9F1|nr:hypothetical protein [Sulfuricurvum sp. IAE1]TDA65784.1 hypothetical protein E0765_04700 [Sulfuricurvum sp. IAE1]
MSKYEAILIDPFAKSISKVEIERGENELKQIYKLLGCRTIDAIPSGIGEKGDRLIVDDEGLFVDGQKFFYINGMKLAGKALYVGNFGSKFGTPEIGVAQLSSLVGFNGDPFRAWIETFLDEKGIDMGHSFTYDSDVGFALISVGAIVDQMCVSNANIKAAIQSKIVEIDFKNGDVLHYFRFLGQFMANQQLAKGA